MNKEGISYNPDEFSAPVEIGIHEGAHRLSSRFGVKVGESWVTSMTTGVTYLYDANVVQFLAGLRLSRKGEIKAGIRHHEGCGHDEAVNANMLNSIEYIEGKSKRDSVDQAAENLATAAIGSISESSLIEVGYKIAFNSGYDVYIENEVEEDPLLAA